VYKTLYENATDLKSIAQKLFEFDTLEAEEIDDIVKGSFQEAKRERKRGKFDEKNI
jgi:ATP-dependent Zn protease